MELDLMSSIGLYLHFVIPHVIYTVSMVSDTEHDLTTFIDLYLYVILPIIVKTQGYPINIF